MVWYGREWPVWTASSACSAAHTSSVLMVRRTSRPMASGRSLASMASNSAVVMSAPLLVTGPGGTTTSRGGRACPGQQHPDAVALALVVEEVAQDGHAEPVPE